MEFAASMMDVYNLPGKQYLIEEADRSGRVAIVLPTSPKEKEVVHFYETVCKNRGWNVQAFAETQEAINWLTRDTPSNQSDADDSL